MATSSSSEHIKCESTTDAQAGRPGWWTVIYRWWLATPLYWFVPLHHHKRFTQRAVEHSEDGGRLKEFMMSKLERGLLVSTLVFTMLLRVGDGVGEIESGFQLAEMTIAFMSSMAFWFLIVFSCVTLYILSIVSEANIKSFIAANMSAFELIEILMLTAVYLATSVFVLHGVRIMRTAVEHASLTHHHVCHIAMWTTIGLVVATMGFVLMHIQHMSVCVYVAGMTDKTDALSSTAEFSRLAKYGTQPGVFSARLRRKVHRLVTCVDEPEEQPEGMRDTNDMKEAAFTVSVEDELPTLFNRPDRKKSGLVKGFTRSFTAASLKDTAPLPREPAKNAIGERDTSGLELLTWVEQAGLPQPRQQAILAALVQEGFMLASISEADKGVLAALLRHVDGLRLGECLALVNAAQK